MLVRCGVEVGRSLANHPRICACFGKKNRPGGQILTREASGRSQKRHVYNSPQRACNRRFTRISRELPGARVWVPASKERAETPQSTSSSAIEHAGVILWAMNSPNARRPQRKPKRDAAISGSRRPASPADHQNRWVMAHPAARAQWRRYRRSSPPG